jgi:hypothetical protein
MEIKMSDLLKVAVTLTMAIPFLYMFYDVTRDLTKKSYIVIKQKAKPAVISIFSTLFQ